jgi:hypothetical protein
MTLGASWLWPNVVTRRNASSAIEEAFWVALVVSAFTPVFAVVDLMRTGEWRLGYQRFVDPAFFARVAFGIRRKSRTCAVAALVLYLLSRAYFWIITGSGNLVIPALIALALFHGVRGTFAYHRFSPLPAGLPSVEDSFRAIAADSRGPSEKGRQE